MEVLYLDSPLPSVGDQAGEKSHTYECNRQSIILSSIQIKVGVLPSLSLTSSSSSGGRSSADF